MTTPELLTYELAEAAQAEARRLLGLDLPAHAATRLRVRAPALAAIRAGIDAELPATMG